MTEETINNDNIENNNEEKNGEGVEHKKKWTEAFKNTHAENSVEEGSLSKLEQENANLKDKLLRTLAELENTRRIATEEKEKTIKFAITNFAKDLINIMENMYLAFKSVENTEKDGEFKIFFDGVNLTFNELKKIFERNNIKRIYPLDEKFDPTYHEAISQIDSDKESGTILDVVQAGYLLNDRVIKAAMVVVAK